MVYSIWFREYSDPDPAVSPNGQYPIGWILFSSNLPKRWGKYRTQMNDYFYFGFGVLMR